MKGRKGREGREGTRRAGRAGRQGRQAEQEGQAGRAGKAALAWQLGREEVREGSTVAYKDERQGKKGFSVRACVSAWKHELQAALAVRAVLSRSPRSTAAAGILTTSAPCCTAPIQNSSTALVLLHLSKTVVQLQAQLAHIWCWQAVECASGLAQRLDATLLRIDLLTEARPAHCRRNWHCHIAPMH